ncbi:ABC transporter permease [Labedaea rhizosphaerae]|uniref:Putative ABC transport system permease protein n=1 Tax=Labedaea rhizosphaerae TaxID=598644 RepID=A0A4R6RYI9_LABRH|nr:ABC transporter permease [Labedaea rhizosphaerae]TDP92212.1 putative ABC transport system permease protein [Labedaea rhizosphaerae]
MQLPWRRAPRAALSSPLTVLVTVVASLLLSFVAGAAVLHASSAGSAAISYQVGRNCEQNMAPTFRLQRMTYPETSRLLDTARTEGRNFGFDHQVASVYTGVGYVDFNGIHPYGRIGYRDGAYDHLTVLQGGDRNGTWVPESFAKSAHVKLGDRGMYGTLPPVTAIYQDITDTSSGFWCTEKEEVTVNALAGEGRSAAVIFVPRLSDLAKIDVPVATVGTAPPKVPLTDDTPAFLTVVHYQLSPVPDTVAAAGDATGRGQQLIDRMKTVYVPTNTTYYDSRTLNYGNYFAKSVEVAKESQTKVRASTLPLTIISLIVGLIGLAAVAVQWCQRRQAELRLLWSRGSGPVALGGRSVLELAVPLMLGSALGTGAALLLRSWYAPPGALPDGTIPLTIALVLAITVAGLVVLGLTTALRTRQLFQGKGSTTRLGKVLRFVPWELITAVLAFLAWLRLDSRPQTPRPGSALIETDATGLAFPLLVVVTVALLLTRLTRWGLALSHKRSMWRWPAGHLAMRRLAAATGSAIGILLVGILAVGTLTVGSGIADAQQQALETKSGLLVGANSSVNIAAETGRDPSTLPKDVAEHSTVVGLLQEPQRTVLVVDPATFTQGAWLGDRDAGEVQRMLASLGPGQAIRNAHAPAGTIDIPYAGKVQTTASVGSFPFLGTKTGYIMTRSAVPDIHDLVSFQLWSSLPLDRLNADLDQAGIPHYYSQTVTKALDGLPFLTVTWTFTFVAALGMVLAVVAAVALVLAVEVRRRQNAVSGALATRMGLRRRTLTASHVLELGTLAGLSTTAGCAAGLITTGVSVPLFDPAPWLRPVASIPDMAPLVLVIYLVTAAVVAMVSWTAVRSVRTAHVGELIRG